ncbi:DegT/DnrJ/EryC1/StrS family aminotransferase [Allohahella marinimesophila]|uniref:dTDP-4-amino-4,6-dideoxygalactose transaminase n=1 Tax=Allohahella marinimesophila TaxID=1054972 RepID=A0ABP7QAY2_9GAMM
MSKYVRPVGHPIFTERGDRKTAASSTIYADYSPCYVNSGTAALQLAIEIALRCATDDENNTSFNAAGEAEVIVPAYGCPDLITACIGANVRPVVVDSCDPRSPFPGFKQMAAAITPKTVAIMAVNFLGKSPELEKAQWQELRTLGGRHIIEDRAQAFPFASEEQSFFGNTVIASFGKGKPVSLLGGGMLLIERRYHHLCDFEHYNPRAVSTFERLKIQAKIAAYNLVIKPAAYGQLLKVPGLNIGATSYKPPLPIVPLDQARLSWLPANAYRLENDFRLKAHVERLVRVVSLNFKLSLIGSSQHALYDAKRMLRFPVLAQSKVHRDDLLRRFHKAGIGTSAMYVKALPDMDDVPLDDAVRKGDFSNARSFADRLFTLPCHSDVDEDTFKAIEDVLA